MAHPKGTRKYVRSKKRIDRFLAMMRVPNRQRALCWACNGMPVPTRPEPVTCEVCNEPFTTSNLDHCHQTGKFRGWLCIKCNAGIGMLGDNSDGVRRALWYLEKFEESVKTITLDSYAQFIDKRR